jgi:hypothetical protein
MRKINGFVAALALVLHSYIDPIFTNIFYCHYHHHKTAKTNQHRFRSTNLLIRILLPLPPRFHPLNILTPNRIPRLLTYFFIFSGHFLI